MRGMGVTIQGEDYVNFAEHKGLTGGRIFRDYYLRNALLPQVTGLRAGAGHRGHLGDRRRRRLRPARYRHGAQHRDPVERLPGDLRDRAVHHHRGRDADGVAGVPLPAARPARPAASRSRTIDGHRSSPDASEIRQPGQLVLLLRYLRRNKSLAIGLIILLLLVAFTVIGFLMIDPKHAYPLAAATKKPPSWQYPFGTDFFGRDLLAAMVVGHVADGSDRRHRRRHRHR